MARIFHQRSSIKLPQPNRDAQNEEYGRELGGIVECIDCTAVHYKKGWHASREDLTHIPSGKIIPTKKHLCPACAMIREHEFEGELFIEKVPKQYKKTLLRLIKNYGDRARQIDAQHRIISIEEAGNGYHITTTENQLADRLAKKIKDAFNTLTVHISHSPEPNEVDRVHVLFCDT